MIRRNLTLVTVTLVFIIVILSGCSEVQKTATWKKSESFTKENLILYGTKGEFGIMKVNGKPNEPDFPVNQGRQYEVFFFDDSEKVSGK
jgi:hypothetical protein